MLTRLQMKAGMMLAVSGQGNKTSEDDADKLINTIYEFFFSGWVRVLILTGLGLFLVIKGVMIGVGIVQASDDQQQRKEKINALKYLIIGVVLVVVLYMGAGAIINMIANSVKDSGNSGNQ